MNEKPKWSFRPQPKTIICEAQAIEASFLYGEKAKDGCSSEKERKVNALALRAEEGRDKLRKAAVSWK